MKDWINIQFSNIGKRQSNQDAIVSEKITYRNKRYHFLLVCDGVGGREFGQETANCIANEVTKLVSDYLKQKKSRQRIGKEDINRLSLLLNNIRKLDVSPNGRTTLAMTIIDLNNSRGGFHSISIWAGDSRIYTIDEGGICNQVSNDQYGVDYNLASVFGGDGKLYGHLGKSAQLIKNPVAYVITSDGMNSKLKGLFTFFYSVISYKVISSKEFEDRATSFLGKIISDNYSCCLLYKKKLKGNIIDSFQKMKIVISNDSIQR